MIPSILPLLSRLADSTITCPIDESGCNNTTGLPVIGVGPNGAGDVQLIFQLVFGVIGAVAVVIMILAAIKLITSQGAGGSDGKPTAIAKAKNTIIYAALGLVVAISAEVIVTFVLGKVK